MKKTITLILVIICMLSFSACTKKENKADTSLKEGEILVSGYVIKSYDSSLLLQKSESYDWNLGGDRAYVSFGDDIQFVVDGYYVTDLTPDHFEDKYISVICSEAVMETYPLQLMGERMIIEIK